MTQSLEEALRLESGTLEFLEQFSREDQEKLLELFEAARETQKRSVDEAIESGLEIIPGFLRKTVRKVLGGG